MDNNKNNGQMNGQQMPKQAQGNKSIFKNESFRKGFLAGAGGTIGAATLYFVGKVVYGKVVTAIKARRETRATAQEPAGEKK